MICPKCKGENRVKCEKCCKGWIIKGTYFFTITKCTYCFGEEYVKCQTCKGTGEIPEEKQK